MSERKVCLCDSHHGNENSARAAVDNLGPRQWVKFRAAFPEWERWYQDQYADDIDPEYTSWVQDWIESNTRMYWEDGDLWGFVRTVRGR